MSTVLLILWAIWQGSRLLCFWGLYPCATSLGAPNHADGRSWQECMIKTKHLKSIGKLVGEGEGVVIGLVRQIINAATWICTAFFSILQVSQSIQRVWPRRVSDSFRLLISRENQAMSPKAVIFKKLSRDKSVSSPPLTSCSRNTRNALAILK